MPRAGTAVEAAYGHRVYRNGFHFKGHLEPLQISDGGVRRVINGSGNHQTSTFSIPDNQWKVGYSLHQLRAGRELHHRSGSP
jgi:hypothetical protein